MKNLTIEKFSEVLFSKEPIPGGGGATALVGALASSLAGMVTSLTAGKKKYAEYEEEIQEIMKKADFLRITLLDCIREDGDNFIPLSKAYSLPKDTPNYDEILEGCLRKAASTPFKILKLSCEVIELDSRLGVIGSKLAVSDAATSAMFAYACLYTAKINVLVNTRLMKDRDYASRLDEEVEVLVEKYSLIAKETYDQIERRLTNG